VQLLSGLNLMDYSLLVGIHNCDAASDHYQQQQQQQLDLGDCQTSSDVVHSGGTGGATVSSSDELDSSGSAGTPPESPLTLRRQRTISFTAELDSCLELFALKCTEREFLNTIVIVVSVG